jgi:hypothetical protein
MVIASIARCELNSNICVRGENYKNIYLSYCDRCSDIVEKVEEHLEKNGLSCCFLICRPLFLPPFLFFVLSVLRFTTTWLPHTDKHNANNTKLIKQYRVYRKESSLALMTARWRWPDAYPTHFRICKCNF